ncbi:MAG: hypothetical protein ACHQRJ_03720 [Alphaproteobacteria bacterium]
MIVAAKRGSPIMPLDAKHFIAAAERYIAGAAAGMTLDRALGLAPAGGQRPWWCYERYQRRDDALRELGRKFSSCLKHSVVAAAIEQLDRRYQRSAAGRAGPERRPDEAGSGEMELIARARATGLKFPGRRQLIRILRGDKTHGLEMSRGPRDAGANARQVSR